MDVSLLPLLLGVAVLLPLASFFVILCLGPQLGKFAGWLATAAIGSAGVLAFTALFFVWLPHHFPVAVEHHDEEHAAAEHAEGGHAEGGHAEDEHPETEDEKAGDHGDDLSHATEAHAASKPEYTGDYYILGRFGSLKLTISYYIDTLTVAMFCMVTLIATLIHFYATGYMHDELHDVTDHEVTLSDGSHLHRPGRYPRFFQYLSLFCFSMLGLVLAGNIAMVFVFWELVGICSYFLIGFYVERKSASTAANKAFIVNRVGDFGMIIGLMALWTALGTLSFADYTETDEDGHAHVVEQGMFSQVRPAEHGNALILPKGFLRMGGRAEIARLVKEQVAAGAKQEDIEHAIDHQVDEWYGLEVEKHDLRMKLTDVRVKFAEAQSEAKLPEMEKRRGEIAALQADINELGEQNPSSSWSYWLLIIAGLGIFCGCVGKSAQFPLHVWLPDAMEGPTPVSALVHSATMVAAGVYLVGRFFPVFVPEVLLVIACVGGVTLFMAATIAITATDIKRVLAYSTVSQLGYMMLALGIGGWVAGLLHLITHAFFKSLLFMCSGSVIHAVHTNEMPQMGGLLKKMPYTAITMLIGCLAIAGAGIPILGVGFSGFHSKDSILEQGFSFMIDNGRWSGVFFGVAAVGATITAFYMFRLWFLTFLGKPRDHHRYDHAHESPKVMYVPLIILSVFAVGVAFPYVPLTLVGLLEQSRPLGTALHDVKVVPGVLTSFVWPNEHRSHAYADLVGFMALGTAVVGVSLAAAFYWLRYLDAAEARKTFAPIYRFLLNKWWFDELYDWLFVRPAHVIARLTAGFDRRYIDGLIDGTANCIRWFSSAWEWVSDQIVVDGLVNLFAAWMYGIGVALREVQTGRIRQYVMFIIVGAIALFLLISFFLNPTFAG